VYLSDTALECVLQELLRAVYTGIALSSVSRTGIVMYRWSKFGHGAWQ